MSLECLCSEQSCQTLTNDQKHAHDIAGLTLNGIIQCLWRTELNQKTVIESLGE